MFDNLCYFINYTVTRYINITTLYLKSTTFCLFIILIIVLTFIYCCLRFTRGPGHHRQALLVGHTAHTYHQQKKHKKKKKQRHLGVCRASPGGLVNLFNCNCLLFINNIFMKKFIELFVAIILNKFFIAFAYLGDQVKKQ